MPMKAYKTIDSFPPDISVTWKVLIARAGELVELLPGMTKGQAVRRRQMLYMYRKVLLESDVIEGQKLALYSLALREMPGGGWTVMAEQDIVGQHIMRNFAHLVEEPDLRHVNEVKGLNQRRDTTMETEKVMQRMFNIQGHQGIHPPSAQPLTVRSTSGLQSSTPVSAVDAAMEAKRQIESGELDETLRGMDECPPDPLLAKRWAELRALCEQSTRCEARQDLNINASPSPGA